MTLFNNISFNFVPFYGLNNWFSPLMSCWNPVGWNIFNGWNQFNSFGNLLQFPFTSTTFDMPAVNWTNFMPNSSIWEKAQANTNFYNNNPFPTFYQSVSAPRSTTGKSTTSQSVKSTTLNISADNISVSGYDSQRGAKLAQIAKNRAHGSSHCAKYVREALNISGILTTAELGNLTHEHAYQWIGILRKFPNKFKEITVTDTNYKHLPAGAIMIYERGVSGYNKDSGHAQIATGDGKAAHFCIQNTLKKPTAIFIPV